MQKRLFVVENKTNRTYVKEHDTHGLTETSNILEARRYISFEKADDLAFDLSDEDCSYKATELVQTIS